MPDFTPFLILLGILLLVLIGSLIIWPIPTLLVIGGIVLLGTLISGVAALIESWQFRRAIRRTRRDQLREELRLERRARRSRQRQ